MNVESREPKNLDQEKRMILVIQLTLLSELIELIVSFNSSVAVRCAKLFFCLITCYIVVR